MSDGNTDDLLNRLDAVRWEALGHAYGSASDVPGLIRNIVVGKRAMRQAAWYELYGNIWHQGTVYEATLHAVPFFVELAAGGQHPDLHEVLAFLAVLANDASGHSLNQERETSWAHATTVAVRQGADSYRTLLSHPKADVRATAANLLSVCMSDWQSSQAWIAEAYVAERDKSVRTAMMFALARLGEKGEGLHAIVEAGFKVEEPISSRTIAALGHVWVEKERTSDEVRSFIDTLTEEQLEEVLEQLPWEAGNAGEYLEFAQQVLTGHST